jgi:hypothetical protein
MKKIKITRDCLVNGQHTPAGAEVNVDIVTAQRLVDAGAGEEIKPGKIVNHNADKVEDRDPVAVTRDPEPAKPATKKAKAKPAEPAAAAAEAAPADSAPAADTPAE